MRYSKSMMNLLIAATGIALAVRSIVVLGSDQISVGLVIGLALILFAGVRLFLISRARS